MRNLQEQVEKAFCYQKLFWPFTVWINWSSDLKNFGNSRPSASNFKSFSRSLEQFFLTVGQNNFGNKIPFFSLFVLFFCCRVAFLNNLNKIYQFIPSKYLLLRMVITLIQGCHGEFEPGKAQYSTPIFLTGCFL